MADASRNLGAGFNVNQFNASANLKSGFEAGQNSQNLSSDLIVCPIFKAGYEDGNFNKWTSTSTSAGCTITVEVPPIGGRFEGVRIAKAYIDNAFENALSQKNLSGYTEMNVKLAVKFTSFPANGENAIFLYVYDSLGNSICRFFIARWGGVLQLAIQNMKDLAIRAYNLPSWFTTYQWNAFQIRFTHSATADYEAWLNSVKVIISIGVNDNASAGTVGQFQVGNVGSNPATTIFNDAVELCSGNYIYGNIPGRESFGGEFIVRHSGSESLPSGFIVKQGIGDLPGGIFVVNKGTQSLRGGFDGQVSLNIKSGFNIRNFFTEELGAGFNVKLSYTTPIPGEFTVRRTGTREFPLNFSVRYSALTSLKSGFMISFPGSVGVYGKLLIRYHMNTSDLGAGFRVGGSRSLKAGFNVSQLISDLFCGFRVFVFQPSGEIIVEDDFAEWFNVVYGSGTGFLSYPEISDDTVIKYSGLNSGKIVVHQLKGQGYKEITFGWCWEGLKIPHDEKVFKAGFSARHLAGDAYAAVDPGITLIVDEPMGHGGGYATAYEPGVKMEIDEPEGHGGIYFKRT